MFKKIVNDEVKSLKKRKLELNKEIEDLNKSIMENKYKIVRYTYGNGKKRYTYLIDGESSLKITLCSFGLVEDISRRFMWLRKRGIIYFDC